MWNWLVKLVACILGMFGISMILGSNNSKEAKELKKVHFKDTYQLPGLRVHTFKGKCTTNQPGVGRSSPGCFFIVRPAWALTSR